MVRDLSWIDPGRHVANYQILYSVQVFYLPQFYQVVFGKSPIASGLLLLPLMLMQCKELRVSLGVQADP
jgi:hypothetical protein